MMGQSATTMSYQDLRMVVGKSASMPNAGFASARGRRATQEDRAYVEASFHLGHWCLMFVLDGHAGTRAVDFVYKNLPDALEKRIKALWPEDLDVADPGKPEEPYEPPPFALGDALRDAMVAVDQSLRHEFPGTPSGACAVVALITESNYIVAHLGDCRAILLQRSSDDAPWNTHALTIDHEPRRPDEKARILASGHYVVRGRLTKDPFMGDINVSRAFGDFEYKNGPDPSAWAMSSIPQITIWPVKPTDVALVLVSDGALKLYGIDVPNDGPLMRSIGLNLSRGILDPMTLAMSAIVDAYESKSSDNMTVAIFVDPHRGPRNEACEDAARRINSVRINELSGCGVDHRVLDCT
jgi:serine/threonine protein phosphatase PrpC